MEESGEASIGPFRIGPSTLLGRGAALRVLLLSSLWRLRARARAALPMAASWLHLRNTHGVLLVVVLLGLLLRKLSGARSRLALARRRQLCKSAMRYAGTYEEWVRAAKVLDRMSDQVNEADFYDVELIGSRLDELRRRREEGSLRDVVFCMRGDLVRNLGNMCNPELHKGRLEVFDIVAPHSFLSVLLQDVFLYEGCGKWLDLESIGINCLILLILHYLNICIYVGSLHFLFSTI